MVIAFPRASRAPRGWLCTNVCWFDLEDMSKGTNLYSGTLTNELGAGSHLGLV
jgi:hypothetical protein